MNADERQDNALTLAQRRAINVHSLSADLVLFGEEDLPGVLSAHGLTMGELAGLLDPETGHEALRAQITQLRKQVASDPKFIIRLRAATALEGHISTLNLMAADTRGDMKDRANVIKLLAELADAMPKPDKNAGVMGVVLQMNFGSAPPSTTVAPVNRVIEHE